MSDKQKEYDLSVGTPSYRDLQLIRKGEVVSDISPQIEILQLHDGVVPSDVWMIAFREEIVSPDTSKVFRHTVFSFPLNPSTIRRSQEKIASAVLANSGYVLQMWGSGPIVLSISGTTGYLNDKGLVGVINYNIKQTVVWRNFETLNAYYQFFNGGNEINETSGLRTSRKDADIFLITTDKLYQGFIKKFSYTEDANDPWQVKYDMEFWAYPRIELIPDSLKK